jgi:hypothetical protein
MVCAEGSSECCASAYYCAGHDHQSWFASASGFDRTSIQTASKSGSMRFNGRFHSLVVFVGHRSSQSEMFGFCMLIVFWHRKKVLCGQSFTQNTPKRYQRAGLLIFCETLDETVFLAKNVQISIKNRCKTDFVKKWCSNPAAVRDGETNGRIAGGCA